MEIKSISHPKPLAFTEASGVSPLRKAVYRSLELKEYCDSVPNADGASLYQSYLTNPDIVVIDDSTLVIDRIVEQSALLTPITDVKNAIPAEVRKDILDMKSQLNGELVDMLIKSGLL